MVLLYHRNSLYFLQISAIMKLKITKTRRQKVYKYILFDLDGTLTDSKEGITKSVQYALSKLDIDVQDLDSLEKFIGPPLMDSFMEYYDLSEDKASIALNYYRERFSKIGLFENKVYPKIEVLLSELGKHNFQLIVATSKPTVFSTQILKHFKLDRFFYDIVGSTLDGTRSRKADVIKYALNKNNIKDTEAIMIGDRNYDILGAKENNLPSIGVTYGYGSYDELKNAGASHIVKNVDELLERLLCI